MARSGRGWVRGWVRLTDLVLDRRLRRLVLGTDRRRGRLVRRLGHLSRHLGLERALGLHHELCVAGKAQAQDEVSLAE